MTDTSSTSAEAHAYCAGLVEAHDRDRFLTVLFAPAAQQPALLALYAFHHEIAKTREAAREPSIGAIRLQWWRESLDGIAAGTPRRHQVVLALADCWPSFDPVALHGLIDAREADFLEGPRTLDEMVAYAASTGGALCVEACRLLGGDAPAARRVAEHVGTAWAMIGLLRALPFQLAAGRLPLPEAVLIEAGTGRRQLLDLGERKGLPAAVREVALAAQDLLEHAERDRRAVPPRARSATRLAVLARGHLRRLARAGFDPMRPEIGEPLPFATWRLALARRLGR